LRERDVVYGLVSVAHRALEGAEAYAEYVCDAERANDDELVDFFKECCEEEMTRERAKQLLAARLGEGEEEDEEDDGIGA